MYIPCFKSFREILTYLGLPVILQSYPYVWRTTAFDIASQENFVLSERASNL
jgi:hypothetical protein